MPGVGPLDGLALAGLDGCLACLVSDLAGHLARGEFIAGDRRVVPGVGVHPDVIGQQAKLIASYEQPDRRAWMSFPDTIRSGDRWPVIAQRMGRMVTGRK